MDDEFNFDLVEEENVDEYILDEELVPLEDENNFQGSVDTKEVMNELLGDNASEDNESEEISDLYELPIDININNNNTMDKKKKEEEEEFDFEEEFVIGDEFLELPKEVDKNIKSSYVQDTDEKDHINADLMRGSFIINSSTSSYWRIIARLLLELSLLKDDVKTEVEEKGSYEERKFFSNNMISKLKELVEKSEQEPKFKQTCQVIGKNVVEFVRCCMIKDLRQMNWENFNNSEENLSTKIALLTDFVQKRIVKEDQPMNKSSNNLFDKNNNNNNNSKYLDTKSKSNLIRSTTTYNNRSVPNLFRPEESSDKNEIMSSTTNLIMHLRPKDDTNTSSSESNVRELLPVIKTWKISIFDENEKFSYEKNKENLVRMMNLVCSQLIKEGDELSTLSSELKQSLTNLIKSGEEYVYSGSSNSQSLIEQNMRITVNVLKEILQQKQIINPNSFSTLRNTTKPMETRSINSPPTSRINNSNGSSNNLNNKRIVIGSKRSNYKKPNKKEPIKITNGTEVFRAINSRDLSALQNIIGTRGKVDLEIIDILGNTPLHIACKMASKEMIFYLLERGSQVNALNNQKKTPLHYLIERNEIQLARILIIQGAKKTERDRWGKTPLEYNSSFAEPLYNKSGTYSQNGGWLFYSSKNKN